MDRSENEKVPCNACGAMILPSTYSRRNGVCAPCEKRRAQQIVLKGTPLADRVFSFEFRVLAAGSSAEFVTLIAVDSNDVTAQSRAEKKLRRVLCRRGHRNAVVERWSCQRVESEAEETEYSALSASRFYDVARTKSRVPAERPDLDEIEERLLGLAAESIASFARSLDDSEKTDRLVADCDATYGSVLLSVRLESEAPQESWPEWKHHGFNLSQSKWSSVWNPISINVESYIGDRKTPEADAFEYQERFMAMVSRVLVRLERNGSLTPLFTSGEFRYFAVDHDENLADAHARMRTARLHENA